MFNLRIEIPNVLHDPSEDNAFRNLGCWEPRLTKNKSLCLEHTYHKSPILFLFNVDLSFTGRDHAGPSVEIQLYRYTVHFKIYDNRHWNYETGTWETKEETEKYERWLNSLVYEKKNK